MGLGCMALSAFYAKPVEKKDALELISIAFNEHGITSFDTANMYGLQEGDNEKLLGQAIKTFRDKIIIATKCAIALTPTGEEINNSPQYIKKCCDNSLNRLGVNNIDLYYLHKRNFETPIEEAFITNYR
jgi:aryl-alcohol dehydrogenase-like predicted oxidoreductase